MASSVPFDTTVEWLIYLFMFLASFCIGLSATFADIFAVLKDRTRTGHILIANVIAPPIVAVILGLVFPLEPEARTMLLLVAFAPGGINAVQFSTKVPGEAATAGAILILLSLISLVTAPFAASFLLQDSQGPISLPILEIAIRVAILFALPVTVGMSLRSYSEEVARKLYKPAMVISLLAFIASVVLSTQDRQEGLAQFGSGASTAFVLFIVILMAIGWLLGGPETEGRQVLAVSTNLRNVGLVYVLVDGCCESNLIAAAVLGLMALMILPNFVLTIACAVWRKKRSPQTE